MATDLSVGNDSFRPPTESTPQKICHWWLRRRPLQLCQIWWTEGFCATGWNITNFYLFIYTHFSGTHLEVRPVDGFSRLVAWTTQTRARMCLFGFIYVAPNLWGQMPKTSNFGGVNKHFQAKLVKSKNVHIIENTASIPTKFCTMIKTTKHAQQIEDGGRPPSWKIKTMISR